MHTQLCKRARQEQKRPAYQIYAAGMASVRSSASQAAWFPQTRAGFSREFCVIWAGRRGAEKEGLWVVSGSLLKAKPDVWSQFLSCYSPPLLQLRGRRQHDTSQPESSRKMRKSCGGNHTGRHQTGHNLSTAARTGYVKACTAVLILTSLCPKLGAASNGPRGCFGSPTQRARMQRRGGQ